MDWAAATAAVQLLSDAARTGIPLVDLPEACRPGTVAEALAIQDRLVSDLGKQVAGWKVATSPEGEVMYGAIFREDCYDSPGIIATDRYPLMGIEGEVAFRFERDLAVGPSLPRGEFEDLLTPFPAFEIVASRFANYAGTPSVIRLADRMSNGGMVLGKPTGAPRDLAGLAVRLAVNADTILAQVGGHSRRDPLLPAIEFVNAMRPRLAFSAGQFITAGTLTGLRYGKAGEVWDLEFQTLGGASLTVV